jgi:hypothetical protein
MKPIELPEPWRIDADGEEHYSPTQMRDHAEAVRRATIEECAQVCDKQAQDANLIKRKSLLTDNGNARYSGMTISAWNCAKAIRALGESK